jgi:outer membrane protein OmpA-like peptidoglycan-associated protein
VAGLLLAAATAASARADDYTPPAGTTPGPGAQATSLAGLSAPVRDIHLPPGRTIITTANSIDGAEIQRDTQNSRTVILDSRVLFAEDRSRVTRPARARLRTVARQIKAAGATGTVTINGYTDDQGSARHGLVLSRQRAEAVRAVLGPVLAAGDLTIRTHGYGEAHPRVPNADRSGRPIPRNQAKNRRVEITFSRAPH